MKNSHKLIFFSKQTPSFELAGGQKDMIKETGKQLDSLLQTTKDEGAAMAKQSIDTVRKIAAKTTDSEKEKEIEPNPYTHANEILINQVAEGADSALNNIVNLKLTLTAALSNLNQAIKNSIEQIQKEAIGAMPPLEKKDFAADIKELFKSDDPAIIKRKAQELAAKMRKIYQSLQKASIQIDISN
ncbi:hypothetical protein KKG71_02800 [Patescibacteria group bacterium]|nr:hypothetical protein [Patescibacteria group bacterium]